MSETTERTFPAVWCELLWRMGRSFDGLSATFDQTKQFLTTDDPTVLSSRDDFALLSDLRDASLFVKRYDYAHDPFDLAYICSINHEMGRSAAIEPGILRTRENIVVTLEDGSAYVPPVPKPEQLSRLLSGVSENGHRNGGGLGQASHLFAHLAKAQPFGDGNKRTALLAANGLLLKNHRTALLSVPVDTDGVRTFNRLLSVWYQCGDPAVIDWLAQWNADRNRLQK